MLKINIQAAIISFHKVADTLVNVCFWQEASLLMATAWINALKKGYSRKDLNVTNFLLLSCVFLPGVVYKAEKNDRKSEGKETREREEKREANKVI